MSLIVSKSISISFKLTQYRKYRTTMKKLGKNGNITSHSFTNRLKTHVNSLWGPMIPPRIFQREALLKIVFAVLVQICSSENIFGVFNIFRFIRIQGQKKISLKNQQNSSIFYFFLWEKNFLFVF